MMHVLTTADRLTLLNHLHPVAFRVTPISPPLTPGQLREQPPPSSDAEQTDRKLEEPMSCCAEGVRDSQPDTC